MIRLGAQLSIARGFDVVVEEAQSAGITALQIFSRNPVGGKSSLPPPRIGLRKMLVEADIRPLFVHAPYFVNPAATDPEMLGRAHKVLSDEMRRAKRLAGDFVVVHPGHRQGPTAELSVAAFVSTVEAMLSGPGHVLIENTAGQGKEIGHQFEQLGHIFEGIGRTRRVGLMLDTAHAMAAGHALVTVGDVDQLLDEVDSWVGLERIGGVHLNDLLYPVGSRRDRHAHLLHGQLGRAALREMLRVADERDWPVILETPGRDVNARGADIELVHELL